MSTSGVSGAEERAGAASETRLFSYSPHIPTPLGAGSSLHQAGGSLQPDSTPQTPPRSPTWIPGNLRIPNSVPGAEGTCRAWGPLTPTPRALGASYGSGTWVSAGAPNGCPWELHTRARQLGRPRGVVGAEGREPEAGRCLLPSSSPLVALNRWLHCPLPSYLTSSDRGGLVGHKA